MTAGLFNSGDINDIFFNIGISSFVKSFIDARIRKIMIKIGKVISTNLSRNGGIPKYEKNLLRYMNSVLKETIILEK